MSKTMADGSVTILQCDGQETTFKLWHTPIISGVRYTLIVKYERE